jgi:hypothetical protein
MNRYLIGERLCQMPDQAVQHCGWPVPDLPSLRLAGFSLHRHLPSKLGLPVGSTSGLRLPATLGDGLHELGEVTGGVQVTIHDQPASLAAEGALGEGELGFHPPAPRACLGGGEEPVGHHQSAAVPLGLVAEQAAQLGHPGIGDGAGQAAVADHPGDVELFHHHRAVLGGERGGELVQRVPAQVGGSGMDAGQPPPGPVPAP